MYCIQMFEIVLYCRATFEISYRSKPVPKVRIVTCEIYGIDVTGSRHVAKIYIPVSP